jgi:hypothetical protein
MRGGGKDRGNMQRELVMPLYKPIERFERRYKAKTPREISLGVMGV